MSLSDCKYGSNYSLHSLPMAENYGKRTFFDFKHTNVPENLDVEWVPLLSLANLRSISKVKVFSFLMGLMLMFLIMASYILTGDKRGLLFTPPPYQLRPAVVPTSTAAAEVSSEKNLIDMELLVKIITSRLAHTSRKVPDVKDIIATDTHLFSVIPRYFLPGIKSPCWYEEFSSGVITDLYSSNLYTLRSKSFKTVCHQLRTNFQQHLYHRDGKQFRFVISVSKMASRESFPLEDYLDLFDLAAQNIQKEISGNSSGDHRAVHRAVNHVKVRNRKQADKKVLLTWPLAAEVKKTPYSDIATVVSQIKSDAKTVNALTGEASASTMWDNQAWSYVHGDKEETGPPFLVQDFIHTVQPDAKIIIMLRDPVERLYSDYLYFKVANKSAEDFHQKVIESIQLFQSCLSERSLRSCVYNTSLSNAMTVRLNLGMYIIFLLDWLTVFHREQILVLRLEDYSANLKVTIKKVFDFLSVAPLSDQLEASLTKQPLSNTRRPADRILGPMLPATRDLLREFHQPLNQKLASVMDNEAFLWSATRRGTSINEKLTSVKE
ncbi:hypothetical protein L3Q82_011935 [Scortum barcoo]|uniref:Uncharacterized protein n=1 Tax=Scortum barcoo TaxID=214431 RepID=A0ACB8W5M1_9TELE|nr:hypothetical protein L3Q82_011935 [Scortum barcoo]